MLIRGGGFAGAGGYSSTSGVPSSLLQRHDPDAKRRGLFGSVQTFFSQAVNSIGSVFKKKIKGGWSAPSAPAAAALSSSASVAHASSSHTEFISAPAHLSSSPATPSAPASAYASLPVRSTEDDEFSAPFSDHVLPAPTSYRLNYSNSDDAYLAPPASSAIPDEESNTADVSADLAPAPVSAPTEDEDGGDQEVENAPPRSRRQVVRVVRKKRLSTAKQ